eukprot:TRINITY_DN2412_c2_g1_i1.p1 TRINITY_DN2412_c2_g1~~TRINITY_DN2412_c2_g1_i1.p1  ORF type:complete len:1289 (-),score=332.26 TRINITY_DN2412_c2_g1_i1:65-3505(-)
MGPLGDASAARSLDGRPPHSNRQYSGMVPGMGAPNSHSAQGLNPGAQLLSLAEGLCEKGLLLEAKSALLTAVQLSDGGAGGALEILAQASKLRARMGLPDVPPEQVDAWLRGNIENSPPALDSQGAAQDSPPTTWARAALLAILFLVVLVLLAFVFLFSSSKKAKVEGSTEGQGSQAASQADAAAGAEGKYLKPSDAAAEKSPSEPCNADIACTEKILAEPTLRIGRNSTADPTIESHHHSEGEQDEAAPSHPQQHQGNLVDEDDEDQEGDGEVAIRSVDHDEPEKGHRMEDEGEDDEWEEYAKEGQVEKKEEQGEVEGGEEQEDVENEKGEECQEEEEEEEEEEDVAADDEEHLDERAGQENEEVRGNHGDIHNANHHKAEEKAQIPHSDKGQCDDGSSAVPEALRSQFVQVGGRTLSLFELCQEVGAHGVTEPHNPEILKQPKDSRPSVDLLATQAKAHAEGQDQIHGESDSAPRTGSGRHVWRSSRHARKVLEEARVLGDYESERQFGADDQVAADAESPHNDAEQEHDHTEEEDLDGEEDYDEEEEGEEERVAEDDVEDDADEDEGDEENDHDGECAEEEEEEEEEEECWDEEEHIKDKDRARDSNNGRVEAKNLDQVLLEEEDDDDWGWGAQPRPLTKKQRAAKAAAIRRDEKAEMEETTAEMEEVSTEIAENWTLTGSAWDDGTLSFDAPKPKRRARAAAAALQPQVQVSSSAKATSSRNSRGSEEQPAPVASKAAENDIIYFAGRPPKPKAKAKTRRSWYGGRGQAGARAGTRRTQELRPRGDGDADDFDDDDDDFLGDFEEDSSFVLARPTRFRPTGCYVRMPGGSEKFLPVEHIEPLTEAATAAIRDRVGSLTGGTVSRLRVRDMGDGLVSMLTANTAAIRCQELEQRRQRMDAAIDHLRENYSPQKWMFGRVSTVRSDGVFVGVIDGLDALLPLKEIPAKHITIDAEGDKEGGEATQRPAFEIGQVLKFRVIRHSLQTDRFSVSMLPYEDSWNRSRSSREGAGQRSGQRDDDEFTRAPSPDRSDAAKPWASKGFSVVSSEAADELNAWMKSKMEAKSTKKNSKAAQGAASSERTYVVSVARGMNTKAVGNVTVDKTADEKEIKQAVMDVLYKTGQLKSGENHKGMVILKNVINVKC